MKKVFCFLFLLSVFLFPTFSQINLISPIKGTWANKQMLVIQVAENEEYLYSLDGTDPEEFGFAYDGPVLLDTTGDIKLRIKKLGNSKEEKIVEFSVKTDDGFNKSYEQFISMFLDTGHVNYTAGSVLSIPSSLQFSLGLPPDSFIDGQDISLSNNSVLTRTIPCTIWDIQTDKKWRFVINTYPKSAGIFSRRDIPFEVNDWETLNFVNQDYIYKIDSGMWSLPTEPVRIDRSISHIVYWQSINYNQGNPIEFFVLPPKPQINTQIQENGAVTYSVSGDNSYLLGILNKNSADYQELFREISIDTFYGDSFSGQLDIGIYADSVYQGKISEEYKINKRPPSRPIIYSSSGDFYSRNKVHIEIESDADCDLFYAISEPFFIQNLSEDYENTSEIFKDVQLSSYKRADSSFVDFYLEPKNEGAVYYKVCAYSQDEKNKGQISEYGVIIDQYNYYFDSNSTAEEAIGTKSKPYKSFAQCLQAINSSNFSSFRIKGELKIPAGNSEILSSCLFSNDGNATITFEKDSNLIVKNSSLFINDCVIQVQEKNGVLIKAEKSILDLNDCQISTYFQKNGTFIDAFNSSVNMNNCLVALKSSNYANVISGISSKINIKDSTIGCSGDTAVILSLNDCKTQIANNSFKVSASMGRIAELFSCEGDFSTNELKGELKSVKKSQAIYKDYESKINLEENNVTGF